MKKVFLASVLLGLTVSVMAAYQYESKGNQGWLTFDSNTTVAFDLGRSGKDKDHENFIDRGEGVVDYGWYNLDTGDTGSFNNGLSATFNTNDRIGLYITDNQGNTSMILVELSKLLKDGKIDRHASRSSQFLQLVDAVFDEAARQMPIEEQDEDTRTDEEQLLDCFYEATPLTFEQMVRKYYR